MHRIRRAGRRLSLPLALFALVALVALVAGCADSDEPDRAGPPGDGDRQTAHQRVEDWLDALVPWGFRGAVAIVEDDGGGADRNSEQFASGFGALDVTSTAGAIDVDTRFGIGSNAKPLTALAVLMLEDRGDLTVEARLGDLLPDVPADKADITVGQLLSHSAGFESAHGLDEEQIGRSEALGRIFGQELLFAPGDEVSYSNSGYTVLAAVVETVSGQDFDDFLRTEIFEPAGMSHTGFRGEPVPAGQHEAAGSDASGRTASPSELSPVGWVIRGNGGVVSSVSDAVALEQAIADGELLSDEAGQKLDEPLVDSDEGGEGYGWVIAEMAPGLWVRAHAGGVPETHHNSLWAHELDGGRTLVVSSADGRVLAEDVAIPIQQLLDGEDVPQPPRLRDVDPTELNRRAGTYRSASGAVIQVEAADDSLRLVTDDGAAFDDLFPLPDTIPDVAPLDEVVELIEAIDDPAYRAWLDEQSAALGPLMALEPVGMAPVDAPEPAAFVRHRFERGAVLTAWAFDPEGEAMSIELAAEAPGVDFRPSAEDGFVSFSLQGTDRAERVVFTDYDVMTVYADGRTVEYVKEE